jgi:hypothetical protein
MTNLSPNSELARDESKIREAAKSCRRPLDLMRAMGWRDISHANRANEVFNLGLNPSPLKGSPKLAQACPKPTGKPKS